MRFTRYFKGDYQATDRKRAAAVRRQRRELESVPLFAQEVSETLPSIDAVMDARAADFAATLKADRARQAMKWRQGRAEIRSLPTQTRQALMAYWQRCCWPGTPVYFLSMLHMHRNNRLPGFVPAP